MKLLTLIYTIILLTGCVKYHQLTEEEINYNQQGNHKILPYNQLQYMSCDFESEYYNLKKSKFKKPNKPDIDASSSFTLSDEKIKIAKDNFVYALMSSNVYRNINKPNFILPNWKGITHKKSDSGLAFEEYHKFNENGQLIEIAIAFRGTEFTKLNDWKANLAIVEPQQHKQARDYIEELIARPYVTDKLRITVTGHSLGGGIALNMSLIYPGINAVTFNQSPRGFYGTSTYPKNKRVLIFEAGEILSFVRMPWYFKLKDFSRTYYNFLDFKIRYTPAINEHSMYLFSRGLLLTAIKAGSIEAKIVFYENFKNIDLNDSFSYPKAQKPKQDKQYCLSIFNDAELLIKKNNL